MTRGLSEDMVVLMAPVQGTPFSTIDAGGKDVTVTTDDFLLEQMERTEQHRTRLRRGDRSRRRRVYLAAGFIVVALLILATPSLISHSSLGRSLVAGAAADYGLDARVESMRIGWITPLKITGLSVAGKSGASELEVGRIDTELTVTDLLGTLPTDLGEISLRDVVLACAMTDGRCSLEDDLAALLESPDDSGASVKTSVKLQDVTVVMTDQVTGDVWQIAQSNGDIKIAPDEIETKFAGVLSEPGGGGGSLQGTATMTGERWQLDLESESLPMSVVALVRRRMPALADTIPARVGGDATGALRIVGAEDVIEASPRGLEIRNLTAKDTSTQSQALWANRLASIDGDLIINDSRLIGRGLKATTDFASVTFDGAFSRNFSFVGDKDNPLRWLEGLEGSATAEVDLALLDQALPGLLPLREGASLVSGRAMAKLDSLPANGEDRRGQLLIRSDELRARASNGQGVLIDPVVVKAIVSSRGDRLTAEEFQWSSPFANAVGQGDLRSGAATVEIDFGRLTTMLRPIVDLSTASLGGSANGEIRWNATPQDAWRLSGSGKATNLVVTMPSGQTLRRPSLEGRIEANGKWGGQTLEELTGASVTLLATGLDLRADLSRAVTNPSTDSPLPLQIQGSGRIETLAETLAPWLPDDFRDAEGGFRLSADTEVSPSEQRVRTANIELTNPRLLYGGRYFSQPNVKVVFAGDCRWPAGEFQSDSMTIASDAFSAAIGGRADSEKVNLQVNWRANLERIQGSVRQQIANADSPVRQVGYQQGEVIQTNDWLFMGDCDGELGIISQGNLLQLDSLINGRQCAIVQPPQAGAAFQTVGPMPSRGGGNRGTSRVVWQEPNVRVDGIVKIDRSTGQMQTESLKVAGDWFATELAGSAIWNDAAAQVAMNGQARIKMEQVAALLTNLTGTQIRATGIQQTPLKISATRNAQGAVNFAVDGNLGWESGEVAGVRFGRASVPVKMTDSVVNIAPSVVPVGQGQINLGGEVHYRPGPLWVRVNPGVVAQNIQLTPDMTNRWLKYLAPLVADAAQVNGNFSAELDEGIVVIDQPERSRVVGRLKIGGAQMTAGPLANQIIGGVEQLKAIARATAGPAFSQSSRTLIEMPPQTIEFIVDRGIVNHKTLFFEVDRAQIVTSGNVSLDGRLNMVAQVPLDARWLGRDLQGLAGQPVTLPIDGTLSRPSLDSRGVRQVVSQLGTRAVQEAADNYLQQQINRGFDKIFGGR